MPRSYGLDIIKPKIKSYILEHPTITWAALAKQFEIWTTTALRILNEVRRNEDGEYTEIVKNAKDIILKGQEKIWSSIDGLDIKNYRDLQSLSSVLKDMSDISRVAEETTLDNMIIPVNITINYWQDRQTWQEEENKITLEENIIDIKNLKDKEELE